MEKRESLESLSKRVIGCMIDVHKTLGPGYLEKIYHRACEVSLQYAESPFSTEYEVSISYRDQYVGTHRLDLLIDGRLVVELKTVDMLSAIHYAQVRSYMKATDCDLGLMFNFAAHPLDVRRVEL